MIVSTTAPTQKDSYTADLALKVTKYFFASFRLESHQNAAGQAGVDHLKPRLKILSHRRHIRTHRKSGKECTRTAEQDSLLTQSLSSSSCILDTSSPPVVTSCEQFMPSRTAVHQCYLQDEVYTMQHTDREYTPPPSAKKIKAHKRQLQRDRKTHGSMC